MKLIPLTIANLKGFVRNWKSVLLLILFPLLLILAIFVSFNSKGLEPVPAALYLDSTQVTTQDINLLFSKFIDFERTYSETHCLNSVTDYRNYLCFIVTDKPAGGINIVVHYDNTRDNVIWEVLERVKLTIEFAEKELVFLATESFVNNLKDKTGRLDVYEETVDVIDSSLDSYGDGLEGVESEVVQSKQDLDNSLDQQEEDVNEMEDKVDNADETKDDYYNGIDSDINSVKYELYNLRSMAGGNNTLTSQIDDLIDELNSVDNEVTSMNNDLEQEISFMRSSISHMRSGIVTGRYYSQRLGNLINQFPELFGDLNTAQTGVYDARSELSLLKGDFSVLDDLNLDSILNPYSLKSQATYIPKHLAQNSGTDKTDEEVVGDVQKSLNLLGLQTLFPSVLMLIVLFLSLLVSTFITLEDINSNSYIRLSLVPKIFFAQIASLFISSHIIIAVPLLVVYLIGDSVFLLPMMANLGSICLIIFLVASSFISIGMGLSYLVKRKSIALLVNTFLLIFFIFYSGFLLPVDRMSSFARGFALIFPGKVGLDAINRIVFYGAPLANLGIEFTKLGIFCVCSIGVIFLIKYLRKL